MEAAGIEPGKFDEPDAVSRRHRAEVRDLPRETGGWRPLSRAPSRNLAGSVDQRDQGGPAQHPIRGIPRLRARRALSGAGESRGPTRQGEAAWALMPQVHE